MEHSEDPFSDLDEAKDPSPDLWHTLLPKAIELLRNALRAPTPSPGPLRWIAPALYKAYPNGTKSDELREVQGALASAATEFLAWRERTELSETPSEDELAFQLMRITYNRWQRRDRGDRRLRRATEVGQGLVNDRGDSVLGTLPEKKSTVEPEFARQIFEVVDEMIGDLSERDRAIILLYLAQEPSTRIALILDCHRTTVARVIHRFRDRFAKTLTDLRG